MYTKHRTITLWLGENMISRAKEEVKENIGRSPDYADMMIMRMYFDLKGQKSFEVTKLSEEEREFIRMKSPSGRISNLF